MPRYANSDDWKDVLDSIATRDCILLLGPKLSTAPDAADKKAIPLTVLLARKLAALLPPEKINDPDHLGYVAEVYLGETGNRTRLHGLLADFYEQPFTCSPAQECLAQIPFGLIINAAPDDMMRRAIERQYKNCSYEFYDFDLSGKQTDPHYDPKNEASFIYHLFGHVKKPSSVVLTESQQLDFAQQIIQKDYKIPDSIQAVFKQSKNYLFLGFDFADWYMRLLLSALNPKDYDKILNSFALHSGDAMIVSTAEVFFGKRFRVGFFSDGTEAFCRELLRRWQLREKKPARTIASSGNPVKIKVVILADEADEAYRQAFLDHATGLEKSWGLEFLDIKPGDDTEAVLHDNLDAAELVVPMLSSSFLGKYYDLWAQRLPGLHSGRQAVVAPVLIKSCDWAFLPGVEDMPVLPRNKKAISSWHVADEAWRHVMEELQKILQNRL